MKPNSGPTDKQLKRFPPPPFAVGKTGHWYQHIIRYWSCFLTGNELKIVLFILDQQLGWANVDARRVQRVRISRSVFSGGIVGKENRVVYQEGVGLADSTIDLILAALEMDQIIKVERTTTRNGHDCWYSLNPLWVPTNSRPSRVKSSPRKSGKAPRKTEAHYPEDQGQRESLRKRVKKEESKSAQGAGFDLSGEKKQRKTEGKSPDLLRLNNPTAEEIEQIWKTAWREVFSDVPLPSWRNTRERFALKNYCTRWAEVNPTFPFGEYLNWCVRNWVPIMDNYFSWMHAAPKYPTPFILIRFSHVFEDIYAHRKEHEAMWRLPSRERMIEVRVRRGMSRENAIREVDEKRGAAKELRQVIEQRAQMASEAEKFRREQRESEHESSARAARMARFANERSTGIKLERVKDYDEIDPSQFNVERFAPYE